MMKNSLLLASDNARARAYVDILLQQGVRPTAALILQPNKQLAAAMHKTTTSLFDNTTPLKEKLNQHAIDYIEVDEIDVNADSVLEVLANFSEKFVIFAGNPGNILSPTLFQLGKQYIHVHPGKLPEERGSTLMYYTLLNENRMNFTAMLLNEKIDEGKVLNTMTVKLSDYPSLDKAAIDNVYDPYFRAMLLAKVIKSSLDGDVVAQPQISDVKTEEGAYYVIHPVLKHIAVLKK